MEARHDFTKHIRFVKQKNFIQEKHSQAHIRLPFFFFIFLTALSASTLAFSTGGFIVDFKQVGFSIFSTLQSGVSMVITGVKNTVNAAKEIVRLKREYEELTERLAEYEYFQRTNAELRAENERLKEQLGFAEDFQFKNYSAMIIARDPDALYSSLTINKGNVHGIKKNMPVIAVQNGERGLVGKIMSVGRYTSMVMPIYDSHSYVSARMKKNRELIGLVSGMDSGELPLSLRYIKKRDAPDLQYGDIVVTSGENGNYLSDVPIGSIADVTPVDYDSSLKIELIPIIDFSRLETVLVVDIKSPFDEEF
jgi:rod shape-determining protein MreC